MGSRRAAAVRVEAGEEGAAVVASTGLADAGAGAAATAAKAEDGEAGEDDDEVAEVEAEEAEVYGLEEATESWTVDTGGEDGRWWKSIGPRHPGREWRIPRISLYIVY